MQCNALITTTLISPRLRIYKNIGSKKNKADTANIIHSITINFLRKKAIMKKQLLSIVVLAASMLTGSFAASAATDRDGSEFAAGKWWQETGYAGLGNPNEVLALVEYDAASGVRPTVNYKLLGATGYITRVKLYAREYDDSKFDSNNNSDNVSNTFAHPFDYRDPQVKNGAKLIAETTDLTATQLTAAEALNASKKYVLYLTADIASGIELPALTKQKTELGADITALTGTTLSSKFTQRANGSRVLVPLKQTLYMPQDYYSKYYRIPAITRAADGSLLAVSDARKEDIHDIANDIDILCRRSTDNGLTWSSPVTIAKGSRNGNDCKDFTGYGDAAVATMSNGAILCTMISGYSLSTDGKDKKTNNYYAISNDNGQSWSALKKIDIDGLIGHGPGFSDLNLGYSRGNIAPGNMCSVSGGYLKGNVLAIYRHYNWESFLSSSETRDYILMYSPADDKWTNLGQISKIKGSGDECHITEIADNKFIVTVRSTNSDKRDFVRITINDAKGNFTQVRLGSCGMSLATATNGEMIKYTDGAGKEYLLHSVPATTANSGKKSGVRSGLAFYQSAVSESPSWSKLMCVSDPYEGDLAETAQYSSLCEQNDGSIGILFEEYPQVIYKYEHTAAPSGDYMMGITYMSLRADDIIPDATRKNVKALNNPVITPASTTYNTATGSTSTHPSEIVISNPNEGDDVLKGNTTVTYSIWTVDTDGSSTQVVSNAKFTGASATVAWSALKVSDLSKLGYVHVKAVAETGLSGYGKSGESTATYRFVSKVRNIIIKARPTKGWATPTISSPGLGAKQQGEVLTVAVGAKVTASATYETPFNFLGFSLNGNEFEDNISNLGGEMMAKQQIDFNAPDVSSVANNDADSLVIYAWYTVNGGGAKTRVYTNYFDSNDNTADDSHYMQRHYFHSDWCSDDNYTESDFGDVLSSIDAFKDVAEANPTAKELTYPISLGETYKTWGLSPKVELMTDSKNCQDFDAVVMVKQDGEYITANYPAAPGKKKATAAKQADEAGAAVPLYYLIEGVNSKLGSTMRNQSKGVYKWYDAEHKPAVVSGIDFGNVIDCNADYTELSAPHYSVDIFVLYRGTSATTVADLVKGNGYIYKVSHPINPSGSMTGIDRATLQQRGTAFVGAKGGVMVIAQGEASGIIYNVTGAAVARYSTSGGEQFVALPQGVYVAAGSKFVVR